MQSQLRELTARAQERLQKLLKDAQGVSMSRWEVVDLLGRLERDLLGPSTTAEGKMESEMPSGLQVDAQDSHVQQQNQDGQLPPAKNDEEHEAKSVLLRLEETHARLAALARGLRWIAVLEQVVSSRYVSNSFSEQTATRIGGPDTTRSLLSAVKKHYRHSTIHLRMAGRRPRLTLYKGTNHSTPLWRACMQLYLKPCSLWMCVSVYERIPGEVLKPR